MSWSVESGGRRWDSIPIGYSIYNPQAIPGWGAYMERYAARGAFRHDSPAYQAWLVDHVPNINLFLLLKILPVTQERRTHRRTSDGVSFVVTQPLDSYLGDPSDVGMAMCADRDWATFDELISKRRHIPSPPPLDAPPAEDVRSWARLGRLLRAGEEPRPLLDLWRRGELDDL